METIRATRTFPADEEYKDGSHEDPAAPWMDWLRNLFPRQWKLALN